MLNKLFSNQYLVTIFRIIFALIFLFAGIEKAANPDDFAVAISNYRILPYFSVNFFAIILAWIEVIAGILLLFGVKTKENISLLNSLLILFTIMILIAVVRGLNIDCGCFGTKYAQEVGLLKISENIVTILIGFVVYKFHKYSIPFLK